MAELRPCPFCGGEAELTGFNAPEYWVWCPNCKASADAHTCSDAAIKAWNTRATRTCHIVRNSRKYVLSDGTELFDDGCSECNEYVGDGDNYCSGCGAKVVKR